jgi:hypothetical protein
MFFGLYLWVSNLEHNNQNATAKLIQFISTIIWDITNLKAEEGIIRCQISFGLCPERRIDLAGENGNEPCRGVSQLTLRAGSGL